MNAPYMQNCKGRISVDETAGNRPFATAVYPSSRSALPLHRRNLGDVNPLPNMGGCIIFARHCTYKLLFAHCSHLTMCLKQFRCNEKLSIHHQRTGDDTVLTWNPSVQVTKSDTSDYLKTAVQSHHPGECPNERAGSQHSAH